MFPNRILIGWLVLVSSAGDVGFAVCVSARIHKVGDGRGLADGPAVSARRWPCFHSQYGFFGDVKTRFVTTL